MAIRYAVAAGNWSDAATWDGGASIPTSGDYVYANGYTVTLDTDVNIGSGTLSTEVCPTTGLGGGAFNEAVSRIITANIVAGASNCIVGTSLSNVITTQIIGNVKSVGGGYGVFCRFTNSDRFLTIYGNVSVNAINAQIYATNSLVRINVIGNVNTTEGSCIIPAGAFSTASFTFNVTGGIIGHTYPVVSLSTYDAVGVYNVTGYLSAQTPHNIVKGKRLNLNGYLINYGGVNAAFVNELQGDITYITTQNADGDDVILYPSTTLENPPAESDVRVGVVYGIDDAYTGTLEVGGATPEEIVSALEASSMGTKILAIPDNLATGNDVDDILTAISEITGTTPEEIVSYLLTQPIGKRMLICAVEKKILGVERRSG